MRRIFTRDVAGFKAGQIVPETDQYFDWDAQAAAARRFHGVPDLLTHTTPVDDAARMYVEGLAPTPTKEKTDTRKR